MLVYSTAAGVCVGVLLSLVFALGSLAALGFLGVGAINLAVALRGQTGLLVLVIFCAGAALGLARAELFLENEASRSLLLYVGEAHVVAGRVVNDPERRESSLHVHVRVETVDARAAQGKLLVLLPREAQVYFGDTLVVSGNIEAPEAFETDSGRVFDYPGYLRARGVSALMRYGAIESREEGGFSLRRSLFAIKHAFARSLERSLPEPNVSLMEGVLMGERRGIPEDINYAFIVAGLIHIVVLSGYNVAIVAEQVLRAFSLFLPRRAALLAGGVGIVLFAMLVGAGATVVRASIMGIIAILARVLNRPAIALRALAVAVVAMVLWNPPALLYDPSFILSALATFGLITLSPWVEKYLGAVPEHWGLRSILASTIAVQIYILPALLYMTGVLSLFALPANALVLPLIPLTMFAGFITGLIGLLSATLALPFAILTNLFLEWILLVSQIVTTLPLSGATVAAFPLWVAVLVYVPLTYFAFAKYRSAFLPRSS